jgi:hypothetical protein
MKTFMPQASLVGLAVLLVASADAFEVRNPIRSSAAFIFARKGSGVANSPATILAATHLLHGPADPGTSYDPLFMIDFNMAKSRERLSMSRLAERLDQDLLETEFLVTGQVNPSLFHPEFSFEDADVHLSSLEEYARSVYALFDQAVSRAEVVETTVSKERPQTISCVWRCSGKANLLWGVDIKPFLITTHWEIDQATGLIARQMDEYSLPQWDLLASALFPFLNGVVTAAPAPPVDRRLPAPTMSPFEAWVAKSGFLSYFAKPSGTHAVSSSPSNSVDSNLKNPMDELVVLLEDQKNSLLDWKPTIDTTTKVMPLEEDSEALPSIRSPNLWDRIQAFTPDDAELVNNLHEAARRTETRRTRRYYYAVTTEEQGQGQGQVQGKQAEEEAAAAAADSSMVI